MLGSMRELGCFAIGLFALRRVLLMGQGSFVASKIQGPYFPDSVFQVMVCVPDPFCIVAVCNCCAKHAEVFRKEISSLLFVFLGDRRKDLGKEPKKKLGDVLMTKMFCWLFLWSESSREQ
jgi:hypothetical protein